MNFSAEKASRKWPCGSIGRTGAAMVTVAAIVLMLGVQTGPASAARRSGVWPQAPWGDLFGERKPRPHRAALRAPVPLPKPRPAEAPTAEAGKPEPEKPAAEKPESPEIEKPVEQAAPAPPPPSACR